MAGLGGKSVTTRGMPNPGSLMDPLWGSPPVRSGPAVPDRGMFDPSMRSFTSGPAWGSAAEWDSALRVDTVGTSQTQEGWGETANETQTIPKGYQVNDVNSAMLDLNTGEQMLIFEEDNTFEQIYRASGRGAATGLAYTDSLGARPEDKFDTPKTLRPLVKDHHQLVKPISYSRLNHYLASEQGRARFGSETNARLLQHTFRFAGVQETNILEEQRTRTEQTVSLHVRGRVRFPNVWLAGGIVPAVGAELFLVPIRKCWRGTRHYKWPGGTPGSVATDRSVSAHTSQMGSADRARLAEARGKVVEEFGSSVFGDVAGRQDVLGEKPSHKIPMSQFADLEIVERPFKKGPGAVKPAFKGGYYWQIVPLPAPHKHCIAKIIYDNPNFQSIPWHVGTCLDIYGGDPASVMSRILHWKRIARNGIFPDGDDDSFKSTEDGYYGIKQRVEVHLAPTIPLVNCL